MCDVAICPHPNCTLPWALHDWSYMAELERGYTPAEVFSNPTEALAEEMKHWKVTFIGDNVRLNSIEPKESGLVECTGKDCVVCDIMEPRPAPARPKCRWWVPWQRHKWRYPLLGSKKRCSRCDIRKERWFYG